MISQRLISSWLPAATRQRSLRVPFGRLCLFLALAMGSIPALAKDIPATVVFLYDGTQGAAYVQVTKMTLNGKAEVRICDGVPKFDKNAYEALPRIPFTGAASLQRGTDGVLTVTVNDKALCAVPANLKFNKSSDLTPAEAAEQAVVQGTAIAQSGLDSGIPEFKPGAQVIFVTAPDTEFADFLRAQRANTPKDWQDFVLRYPSSTRLVRAQNAIAKLHQQGAEAAFAQYQKSSGTGKQDIASLRQAWVEAQAANQASAGYDPPIKLMDAINRELDSLLEPERARLQAFRKALQDHGPGYSQLALARADLQQFSEVRSDYAPLLNLRREVGGEERKAGIAVATAESLTASGRCDDAVNALGPYASFASEMPRVDAVLNAAYEHHFDNGQKLAGRQEWERAAAEFRKAVAIRPDNKEAAAALNNATTQIGAQRDQQAANLALLESNEFASKSQFVEAYNVLADLPDRQRALVTSQLSALAHEYVGAATRRAQKLQEVHIPIQGRADEDAVREAYVLLDRASSLSGDPAITLKRDFLSSKISGYYVEQARRYLDKPAASGAGVGWLYLQAAQRYGITNLDYLKDQMARYAPLYQRRARLSVGITLRDETSRAYNPSFADQLADAIANELESSGVSIEVVRKPSEAADALPPNFMLVGELREHRVVKNENLETPESKYRAGTHEVKNPAWLQARTDYESAQQQLAAAQQALTDAQSHKKKDLIAAANDAVQQAQAHADELRHKLETTDQSRVEAIVEPYHYTKKTVDLSASIQLAFHMNDLSGNAIGQPADVRKSSHKTALVLQDVKPEDTEGITNQSVAPDETQFLTDLEIEARDALIKAVRESASELPAKVLQEARTRAQHGDMDGAAESYIVYLNSTPDASSPERDEAAKFLQDRFNLSTAASSKL
jgi:hypothetical protein